MSRHWLRVFLSTFLIVTTLLTGGLSVAQDEALPPSVIDVWPLPGVELGGRDTLTLTFDQPMDEAATTAAFGLLPDVAGSVAWPDARTLVFTPESAWPGQTDLLATVSTDAQSQDGVTLESAFQTALTTVGPLLVGTVSPEPDSSAVAVDTPIIVTFNRPVVALGSTADMTALPSPIQITPAVEGSGEWVNTSIYSFVLTEPLAGSTTYTVTVDAGLSAVDGATLDESYAWQFRTLPPEVLSVSPAANAERVELESDVTITFSQPMDAASVEAAFRLGTGRVSVAGTFDWNDDFTEVTFTPSEPLAMETRYDVVIGANAQSANGQAALGEPYTWQMTTIPYPRVSRVFPNESTANVDPAWVSPWIEFTVPVDFASLEGRIHISPEPEGLNLFQYDWSPSRVNLEGDWREETTYTVTVDAGVQDLRGNVSQDSFTYRFTTDAMRPEAYPVINGNFVITNANREDTRMLMMTSGRGRYELEVYKATAEDVSEYVFANFDDYSTSFERTFSYVLPDWATEDRLIRSVSAEFDTEGSLRVPQEILLASESGGQLPPGQYWISTYSNAAPQMLSSNAFQFGLAVVDTHVTVKRGPETTVVWLTDLETGDPVAGMNVRVYLAAETDTASAGTVLAEGTSGDDGAVTLSVALPVNNDAIYIVAEGAGSFGAWYSNRANELPTERAYLYTDRPIYRPGETVYFRGVARDRHDMNFSVPDEETVHITIRHPWREEEIYAEMDVDVTEFGTFSGSYEIPNNQELGEVAIAVDFGDSVSYQYGYLESIWFAQGQTQAIFTIADFVPPLYEVNVTAETDSIVQGDPLNAVVEATYYAGGKVNNALVSYSFTGNSTWFNYQGRGRYSFVDIDADSFWYSQLGSGEARTGDDGRLLFEGTQTVAPALRPMEIIVEATIRDESSQPVSSSTRVLAHPAAVYVGIASNNVFARAGAPIALDILTVTPDSAPVVGQPVDITVTELKWSRVAIPNQPGRYRWQLNREMVATDAVITSTGGLTEFSFTPPRAGIYRIRATTRDAQERLNAASTTLYVTGGDETVYWGDPGINLALHSDKASYLPDETATILIPMPDEAEWTVLVTAERAGVMTHEVVTVEGTSLLYELPLEDAFAPTVFVSATAVRGATADDPNPGYATGAIRLDVEPVRQRLTIVAEPSVTRAEPQGEVTFELTATDADGEPVQAEIGLALVDKSVLAIMPPNSTTLEETFYGTQRNYVMTEIAMSGLIDRLTDALFPGGRGGGGGGGGGEALYIRDDFEFTPLWAPHVVTDENGRASVSVRLPDNLTTWQLDARAVTLDTEVGQTTTEILSTLPLRVNPVAPRFFVVGDRAQVGVIVYNNTDDRQTVNVSLDATGVTVENDLTQVVEIDAGARVRVNWDVVVQDVAGVDLVFAAVSESGYQDAARPLLTTGPDNTIPVYAYSAPDTTGTGGMLLDGGAVTEAIALPSRLAGAGGELLVNLDPSLVAAMTDALGVAETFRCDCNEQVASKLLQNIMTYEALRAGNVVNMALENRLVNEISDALRTLRTGQNSDGGWSWITGADQSDPLVTAYVTLALDAAHEAGFNPGRGTQFAPLGQAISLGTRYIQSGLTTPTQTTPAWQLNRQAFYMYVLSEAGYHDVGAFNALLNQRLRMSYAAHAYLLMAVSERDSASHATLLNDLTAAARLSANGAHWEEDNPDWYNWGSDTRTTALAINAIASVDPDNPLLPNAIRWLMQARRGDHWMTTQETVWSLMALSRWMRITGEMNADYAYEARLNGEILAEAQVAPTSVRDGQELAISVAGLERDGANRLTVARTDGEGALYYSAYLDLTLPADEVQALSRGITVEREYYLNGDRNQRTTQATVGDVITVRVTLTLPEDIPYFSFVDPIPAGTESINTRLLTTSQSAQGPRLAMTLQNDPYWFFGWWWFDRTELRDAETRMFADFLPRGTYVYTYQLRATLAGEYQVMPAHASAMYQPDVFGRTDGTLFTILPNDDVPLPDAPDVEPEPAEAVG